MRIINKKGIVYKYVYLVLVIEFVFFNSGICQDYPSLSFLKEMKKWGEQETTLELKKYGFQKASEDTSFGNEIIITYARNLIQSSDTLVELFSRHCNEVGPARFTIYVWNAVYWNERELLISSGFNYKKSHFNIIRRDVFYLLYTDNWEDTIHMHKQRIAGKQERLYYLGI